MPPRAPSSASHSGRAIEDADTRARLERWAAERKSNRTVDLSKQLLRLPPAPEGAPSSRELCLAHDVAAVLRRSPPFTGLAECVGV